MNKLNEVIERTKNIPYMNKDQGRYIYNLIKLEQ